IFRREHWLVRGWRRSFPEIPLCPPFLHGFRTAEVTFLHRFANGTLRRNHQQLTRAASFGTVLSMSEPQIPFSLRRIARAHRRACKTQVFITVSVWSTACVVNAP